MTFWQASYATLSYSLFISNWPRSLAFDRWRWSSRPITCLRSGPVALGTQSSIVTWIYYPISESSSLVAMVTDDNYAMVAQTRCLKLFQFWPDGNIQCHRLYSIFPHPSYSNNIDRITHHHVLLNSQLIVFIQLKMELLTQYPASNDEKILLWKIDIIYLKLNYLINWPATTYYLIKFNGILFGIYTQFVAWLSSFVYSGNEVVNLNTSRSLGPTRCIIALSVISRMSLWC